ncbi:MAG: hypothetical protein QOE82_3486 [Thermoanaerobaculia bacterium]|nr:hypothetical protein [Thermoanaerobaculia bacterium]
MYQTAPTSEKVTIVNVTIAIRPDNVVRFIGASRDGCVDIVPKGGSTLQVWVARLLSC